MIRMEKSNNVIAKQMMFLSEEIKQLGDENRRLREENKKDNRPATKRKPADKPQPVKRIWGYP